MAPAEQLLRVAVVPGGELGVGRRLPGRGAWLCADSPGCVEAALRQKAFGRALRADIPPASLERLRSTLAERARIVEEAVHRGKKG